MKIAIPMADGRLAMHFGHCQEFAFVEADPATKQIIATHTEPAPAHEPGLLPRWLAEHGAHLIIAGGMGRREQDLFTEQDIRVIVGAPALDAQTVAQQFLDGTLESGDNICDH